MTTAKVYDVAVVGGGIVGVATAYALLQKPGLSVVVLEAEALLAPHQTGHNSGVIHSGLYYRSGSQKATFCRAGRALLIAFCLEREIPHRISGKLVVATRSEELPRLDELLERGRANGLQGLRRLSPEQIREFEPEASGLEAIHVPEAGVVDFGAVTAALAEAVRESGGEVRTDARVLSVHREGSEIILATEAGDVRCRVLVGCAGLQADRFARMTGLTPSVRIVPFRGDYFELVPERRTLVNALIYPVPDPRFPFLGVHFTRRISGHVEVGPNAVLSLHREGYGRFSFSARDARDLAFFPGLWRFLSRNIAPAAAEVRRSLTIASYARAARELIPVLRGSDLVRAGCGVRAQAMKPDGTLVDDFEIQEAEGMVHVLNAPSPAATASLEIGRVVAERVRGQMSRGAK